MLATKKHLVIKANQLSQEIEAKLGRMNEKKLLEFGQYLEKINETIKNLKNQDFDEQILAHKAAQLVIIIHILQREDYS